MAASTYTTIAGDTWDIIAYRLFGNEFKMSSLQQANPDYLSIVVFDAGVVLNVPAVEISTVSTLPVWQK